MKVLLLALLVVTLAAPVRAQAPRYAPLADNRLQQLTDELSTLIDEAEKARAADYRFLRDLRDLVRRYGRPWRKEILFDDFRDGNFTENPTWTVKAGRFDVVWRDGLRSRIEVGTTASAQPQQSERKTSGEDVAKALLGALLQQALKDKSKDKSQDNRQAGPAPAPRDTYAQIYTAIPISNAFAIRLDLRSFEGAGRLALGPYQGADQAAGYSLAYNPGATPSLELLRASPRGTALLDSYRKPLVLEDGKGHVIEWTRDPDGLMAVSVDGKMLLEVTDRGFRDPFDGFTLVNFGGDFALREIAISGTGRP